MKFLKLTAAVYSISKDVVANKLSLPVITFTVTKPGSKPGGTLQVIDESVVLVIVAAAALKKTRFFVLPKNFPSITTVVSVAAEEGVMEVIIGASKRKSVGNVEVCPVPDSTMEIEVNSFCIS